jgi:acylphosphatase
VDDGTERALRLVVTGRVQGVGFRYSTCVQARRLGLCGWVRNRRDGSVEILVAGPPAECEALVGWARRGPAGARVDAVEVTEVSDGARALIGPRFEEADTA